MTFKTLVIYCCWLMSIWFKTWNRNVKKISSPNSMLPTYFKFYCSWRNIPKSYPQCWWRRHTVYSLRISIEFISWILTWSQKSPKYLVWWLSYSRTSTRRSWRNQGRCISWWMTMRINNRRRIRIIIHRTTFGHTLSIFTNDDELIKFIWIPRKSSMTSSRGNSSNEL